VVTTQAEAALLSSPHRADCPGRRIPGRTLREPLRALEEWPIAHLGGISASQEAYDHTDRPLADSTNPDK
jgi:hypothetical protein